MEAVYGGSCDQCRFEDANLLKGACNQPAMGYNVFVFLSIIEMIIKSQCSISDPCRRVKSVSEGKAREYKSIDGYDFIVVGGGVGGTIVASRLSENPKHTVLLLEAGPEEPSITSVPAFAFKALNTSYDWKYRTVPQKNACLNSDGVCHWPRGKMLCGTACLSGLMYTRGNRQIYDQWAANGNDGWNYDELLYYFKKSENNSEPRNEIEPEFHGFDGPLPVSRFPYMPELGERILLAARELGYRIGDLNGSQQTGFAVAGIMTQNGVLTNPCKSFLRPVLHRRNLRVLIRTFAKKIHFDETYRRATGVEYIDEWGYTRKATARKEVILSGGVIGSPHLLLLSGVGPERDLKAVGIKAIRDLPVGRNLHYHVGLVVKVRVQANESDTVTAESVEQYLRNRTGPLSSTGLTQITAFVGSSYATDGVPDMQFYLDGLLARCDEGKYRDVLIDVNFRPIYLLTKCRGYLKLKSTNPYAQPEINPNYLCNDQEIQALVEAAKIVKDITKTRSMRDQVIEFDVDANEQCASLRSDENSDLYWRCVITRYTNGENHHSGTCKMGPASDRTAVVDSRLRVHGIPNLRVIDASILPSPINCNTIGPTVMVAEKGSDMIKATWR